jgi:transposase
VANCEVVLDVPAKLAARVRVFSQGHGRKTDRDDAVSIGLAALNAAGVQAVQPDGAMVSLRLWCDRRDELVAARTQAICRLHRLLTELTPGGSGRELSATMAAAMLKLVRPKDDVSRERKALALQHLGDVRSLDRRIKAARDRIAAMVEASGTGLVNLYGVGPLVAGRVLAEVGDVGRFPTKDHFATYNGTAPIDVSSGEQVRHRLSRSGNRRVNHALHIMAVVQIRNPKSDGRAYYERKRTEGKTSKEALRCLKRRLSDVIFGSSCHGGTYFDKEPLLAGWGAHAKQPYCLVRGVSEGVWRVGRNVDGLAGLRHEVLVAKAELDLAFEDREHFLEVVTMRRGTAAGRNVHIDEGVLTGSVVTSHQNRVGVADKADVS